MSLIFGTTLDSSWTKVFSRLDPWLRNGFLTDKTFSVPSGVSQRRKSTAEGEEDSPCIIILVVSPNISRTLLGDAIFRAHEAAYRSDVRRLLSWFAGACLYDIRIGQSRVCTCVCILACTLM